ncbi:MAG TPA: hypothetical protein VF865_11925 [Acidobacteriaceae bacterium]
MKKLLSLCVAMVMAFTTASAFAATDISGTWTGDMKAPDGGSSFQLSFTFKQDGAKLTGTVLGPQGDPISITEGVVTGDKFTFNVSFNGMTIVHEGTIVSGDEIKLTSKSDMGPAADMTLKRAKTPAPAN